jgi:hypothetical protein
MLEVAKTGRIAVLLLVATSSSGCATLMQPFAAMQPTAAIVESASGFELGASEDVSTNSATTSASGQWITHVYQGWAGPSSQM